MLRERKKAAASKTQTGPQMSYREVSRLPSALTSPPQNYLAQRNANTCQKPSPVYHVGYLQDQVKLKELWELLGSHLLTSSLWHLETSDLAEQGAIGPRILPRSGSTRAELFHNSV